MKYLLLFLIVLLYSSCKNERDNIDVCYNGGVYKNGGCVCNTGFAGKNCETALRNKLIGNWRAGEFNNSLASQYSISIQPHNTAKNAITIDNFLNHLNGVQAYVINEGLINIPPQQLQGKSVMGTGYVYTPNDADRFVVFNCVITDLPSGVGNVVVDSIR